MGSLSTKQRRKPEPLKRQSKKNLPGAEKRTGKNAKHTKSRLNIGRIRKEHMKIKVNRLISEPPARDYSRRDTAEAAAERLTALTALKSLRKGQSIAFTGEEATRDRVNSFLSSLQREGYKAAFSTARIFGGIGVWRVG
jgi:hypothetical protein